MPMNESSLTDDSAGMSVQSISRAMQIIHLLEETAYPLTLGQIAKQVSLPRSTVQRLTNALKEESVVTSLPGLGLALQTKGAVSCKNRTINLLSENDSKGLTAFKRYLENPYYEDNSLIICSINEKGMIPVLSVSSRDPFAFNLDTGLDETLLNEIHAYLKSQKVTCDRNKGLNLPNFMKSDADSTYIEKGKINPYRGTVSVIKQCKEKKYSMTIFGLISNIKKSFEKMR
ncbi:helix-turn-helix domain-containing protein [Rouxiella badensis]|uniref:helix-turn-helix domain-containing protein n=1 Tax=Rouxiella badensis TaxID=1646377 RepID=UPI001D14D183|nr:helix-turn-helix domain-containing protein [Rouxiella badensis]MCC3735277.1 helix-turn-helix domain-containing protein [Rouxiella badensis]MCC3760574.1 helix-turn-helix domain-containing protein [Rouxiella badensis]